LSLTLKANSYARWAKVGLVRGAHSIRFDPQDNMWYIDASSNMVIKFDLEGRTQEVLGMRLSPGRG